MKTESTNWAAQALVLALALAVVTIRPAHAQVTLAPWGNLTGLRVVGQPVDFEAGLRLVHPNWTGFSSAVKYLQKPSYSRSGATGIVESAIEGVAFKIVVEDTGRGEASLDLEWTVHTNAPLAGVYFCFELPDAPFLGGSLELVQPGTAGGPLLALTGEPPALLRECLRHAARGLRVKAPRATLEVGWTDSLTVCVRREASDQPASLNDPSVRQRFLADGEDAKPSGYQVYLELLAGSAAVGGQGRIRLNLKADATPDDHPVNLVLDPASPGRPFDGIGGNFRLQFPETDAAVLQYNLENLPCAWGRFDLPWAEWDPVEHLDPLARARAGDLHPKILGAHETARALGRRQVPLMVSAWVPPKWACAPSQPVGLRGVALDDGKIERISASLTSYLLFLKEHAGAQAAYFSFNEPETGVEVRQTPEEHLRFIKVMGRHLAQAGLTTKLLLGDTAHGTPAALDFIRPTLADVTAHPHIGAVAFHTWRGCTAEVLPRWAEAARQLGVPLFVTEAGPDAHLHEYPGVRLEPWFQLQEIELYVRICALAQPASIMEWQLTSDYSVLAGAGVYHETGPLKPTQRFWNLRQLAATPRGAFALPVSTDRSEVTPAAFGDLLNGQYILHVVNRGAERRARLAGWPASVSNLRRFTTDASRGMQEGERLSVWEGRAESVLPAASYVTFLSSGSAVPSSR